MKDRGAAKKSTFPIKGIRSSGEKKGNAAEVDRSRNISWGHREDPCHCRTGGELYKL